MTDLISTADIFYDYFYHGIARCHQRCFCRRFGRDFSQTYGTGDYRQGFKLLRAFLAMKMKCRWLLMVTAFLQECARKEPEMYGIVCR